MLRACIVWVMVASSAIAGAEPYTGTFATDGVFNTSAEEDAPAVRNHLELTQTGSQIRGRLVLESTTPVAITGVVAANGRASLAIANTTFPIVRVKSGIEISLGERTHLFKRAPSLTPLPSAVLTPGAASGGTRFTSPWGWSFAAPARWTTKPRAAGALVEGDRIALYVAAPRSSNDATRDALAAVLNERQGEWQLLQEPAAAQLPGATVELLEVAGFDDDETEWRARVVGVTTKLGTVAITGIARVTDLEALRTSVDAVARSAKLVGPAANPATKLLTGEWSNFVQLSNVVGVGGTTYTLSLCANGTYVETVDVRGVTHNQPASPGISVQSKRTITGQWVAVGDATKGTIYIADDAKPRGERLGELAYLIGAKTSFSGMVYARKALGYCDN